MFYQLPNDFSKAIPLLHRFQQENLAVSQEQIASRRRPFPVRNLLAVSLVRAVQLSWIGPQNLAGVTGYTIYTDNENSPALTVPAPEFPSNGKQGSNRSPGVSPVLRCTIPGLVTGVKTAFYVSCYTSLMESIKSQIIIAAS